MGPGPGWCFVVFIAGGKTFLTPCRDLALGEGTMNNMLNILETASPQDDQAAIPIAQQLWFETYGDARTTSRGTRIDTGTQRSTTGNGEHAWIKKRRDELSQGIAASSTSTPSAASADAKVNARAEKLASKNKNDSHYKELNFQKDKETTTMIEALEAGLLLPEEISDDLQVKLIEHLQAEEPLCSGGVVFC